VPALESVAKSDEDLEVRKAATNSLKVLEPLLAGKRPAYAPEPRN
jgi:hypothetical protein